MYALFEDGGKFLAGRVMTEADSSMQIELDSGKRVKVKAANVLLKFDKPVRVATRLGTSVEILHAVVPRVTQILMNTTFRMFPDSAAAKGEKGGKATLSAEAMAMAEMMRGIHF